MTARSRLQNRLRWLMPCAALAFYLVSSPWNDAEASTLPPPSAADAMALPERVPDASDLIADRLFNPTAKELSALDRIELQGLVDTLNADIVEWQATVRNIMGAWAQVRIDAGQFQLIAPGQEVTARQGAALVRTLSRDMVTRDVWIYPGESAELDLALVEANTRFAHRVEELRELVVANGR